VAGLHIKENSGGSLFVVASFYAIMLSFDIQSRGFPDAVHERSCHLKEVFLKFSFMKEFELYVLVHVREGSDVNRLRDSLVFTF